MDKDLLVRTVSKLVMQPKGILAIDESINTCNARFEKLGIAPTEEKRREYRELLVSAPGIENYISGYITFDETIRQSALSGKSFTSILQEKGIQIGIKVDTGLVDLPGHPGEKVTNGLDGLADRLKEYRNMGATFAKWRAVYTISDSTPSEACIRANAEALADYAFICQENNIVPMVEPEVLMDGNHTIEKCYEVTAHNLDAVFQALAAKEVFLPGVILKTSMVLPGKDSQLIINETDIARMTVKCLKEHVPPQIGGIVFLSGGQSDEAATSRLNEMHKLGGLPWPLSFSYGRAIQNGALKSFASGDLSSAQNLLVQAAEANSKASVGEYQAK